MASRFQEEEQPEAVKEERRLGNLRITKVTVDKPPVNVAKVTPEIEESIRNAAKVMAGINSMLKGYLYPACELAIALKNASDPSKVADAKYTENKKAYSVEVTLAGRPLVVTVKVEDGVYAAVSDKKGNVMGYLEQDGNRLSVDGKGAQLNPKLSS